MAAKELLFVALTFLVLFPKLGLPIVYLTYLVSAVQFYQVYLVFFVQLRLLSLVLDVQLFLVLSLGVVRWNSRSQDLSYMFLHLDLYQMYQVQRLFLCLDSCQFQVRGYAV